MKFDVHTSDLPVKEIIPDVQKHLNDTNALIVHAPPGAGKSTLLPLALLDEGWLEGKKMIMLEPRRLAARSIATRMSELLGESVGQTVGYRIRFETKVSDKTKIEVVTEGILTRMLQSDNSLEDVALVIFDEFHERSIHADLALALCRESQQVLRPDLRIMIMSATLDIPKLTELIQAPVAESKGRQYPVDIKYIGDCDQSLISELTANAVLKALREEEGDILVFLPGQGEISRCEDILKRKSTGARIHPLYGQLPQGKQYAAIMPDKGGARKVVLATNIAETSLTIEGIKVVIDSGFARTLRFDPNSGLSRLETALISKDAADQRAGRAGRLSEGVCYRMWSSATHNRLENHRVPEIAEADLTSLTLDMAHWGVNDIDQLTWLTPPPKGAVAQATDTLHDLNALEDNKITAHGKNIYKLPCHPRIAHMLLMAEEEDQVELAADIAAIIEERDPLPREAGIDINLRVEALRRHRKENSSNRKFQRIEKVAASYRKLFELDADNSSFDPYESGVLLTHAYPERIACARPGNNAQFQLSNGRYAMAGHKDDLAYEPWLAVAHLNARDGMGKIFMAAPLNPRDLQSLVKEEEVIKWDTEDGGLIASLQLRIGNIVLQSKPLPDPDPEHLQDAIIRAIKKEGKQLLNFDKEVIQWQHRVLSLRKWNPEQHWPDTGTNALLSTCHEWLLPYLQDVKRPQELKKLDLKDILHHSLDYEQQQLLLKLAPVKIKVPSGSNITLDYQADGSSPVLSVRLQETFGLLDTPTVNHGKNTVLMHLLSPGFKPVQITSDLNSFWKHTYFEVKKDLKGRYPKHEWPDDPLKAEAVSRVKKRKA